jgi:hypothetical protein
MNGNPWSRPLALAVSLWAATTLSARAQTAPLPSTSQEPAGTVDWLYLPPGCALDPGDLSTGDGEEPRVVHCGATGAFVLSRPGLRYRGDCRALGGATEDTPAAIPIESTPSYPSGFPCAQGSCFRHKAGTPWVAVVDWPSEHGWSVAATLREAADQRVETVLYDLTDGGTLATLSPSVSDLHVLVQLCALAEDVKARPADRPLAVNLSFGRMVTPSDCTQTGGSSGTLPTLGCAIGRVLADLAGAGVLPVASAGNHHELLFPAASPGVVSAGAIDLAWLEKSQQVKPSSQTPGEATALMLGYGIYLSADGKPPYWAAPPGSSYAAALLTGWLGGTIAGGGKRPDPAALTEARWAPAIAPDTDVLALALDGAPLPGSALAGPPALLDRAREAAGPAPDPGPGFTLTFQGDPAPTPPTLSVLHADTGNGPQPGIDPCVPCGGGPPIGAGAEGGYGDVTVDLSSSGGLPDGMALVAVFLRAGRSVYSLQGSRDPDLLASMETGSLASLTLSGIGGLLQNGEQPSLVLVVNVGGLAYWHEVPIHLPAPRP